MNHIAKQEAELISARAEIEALRESFRDLRSFVLTKANRDGRDGYIQATDVSARCEQAYSYADSVAQEAYYNEVGPAIATGGCPYIGRTTCTHEPSLRPNGYHCPLCAELLPGDWNDTEARAQERMRVHFRTNHREEN